MFVLIVDDTWLHQISNELRVALVLLSLKVELVLLELVFLRQNLVVSCVILDIRYLQAILLAIGIKNHIQRRHETFHGLLDLDRLRV